MYDPINFTGQLNDSGTDVNTVDDTVHGKQNLFLIYMLSIAALYIYTIDYINQTL